MTEDIQLATLSNLSAVGVLLELVERAALAAGYYAITLHINAAMTQNIALYSRVGMVKTIEQWKTGCGGFTRPSRSFDPTSTQPTFCSQRDTPRGDCIF
jgi:hypothetical protein